MGLVSGLDWEYGQFFFFWLPVPGDMGSFDRLAECTWAIMETNGLTVHIGLIWGDLEQDGEVRKQWKQSEIRMIYVDFIFSINNQQYQQYNTLW